MGDPEVPTKVGQFSPGFAYVVYGFQAGNNSLTLDSEDACNRLDIAVVIANLDKCRVNPWLVS